MQTQLKRQLRRRRLSWDLIIYVIICRWFTHTDDLFNYIYFLSEC